MADEYLSTLTERLAPQHTAIVVVDAQNDFCEPEGAATRNAREGGSLYNGESLEVNLPGLLAAARRAGAWLVFVRVINDPVYLSPPCKERLDRAGILGNALLEGTWGADYWRDFRPVPGNPRELEIVKHRYSAFTGTNFDQLMKSNGIKTLAFTGLATSGCVESSARDALFHDYYSVMVSDCVADGDRESHDAALRKFARTFGDVVDSREVVGAWQSEAAAGGAAQGGASGAVSQSS